jgi:hypothetical protein
MARIFPFKRGYKVVRVMFSWVDPGKKVMKSLYRLGVHEGAVEFTANKWTNPLEGCGPLTVLNSRKAAQMMAKYIIGPGLLAQAKGEVKVFRCDYEPSRSAEVWVPWHRCTVKDLEKLNPFTLLPGGTSLAQRVRITKEIVFLELLPPRKPLRTK